MSIYKNNLAFLEKYAPILHHTVVNELSKYKTKIMSTINENNFKISYEEKICFANSHYSTDEELEETFQFVDKECQVLVLVGIGNGQVINYIKDHFKSLKGFFVVEPFLDVFKKYIENNSFEAIFSEMGLITFIVNKNEDEASQIMQNIFESEQYTSLEIVCLSSYASLLENYFSVFKERVLRGFRSRISQFVTLHQSRYNWLNNSINNFRFSHIDHEHVLPLLKGKPAVIVAAGPSLNKHMHLLDELKEKAVIIGAGSAIKILNSKRINPHFRMAIDAFPSEDLYDEEFYKNSDEVPLLYASQLYYEILPKYKGHKLFMTLPTDALGKYIQKKIQKKYKLVHAGASVVHSALNFLCEAGCNPIIFIGQDMCFYENELYAEGRESDKLTNYDTHGWIKQKDIYGNDVYTIRSYLQIKYDYERMLKSYPHTAFINATEGGLGIEGTLLKTLDSVMQEELQNNLNINFEDELERISAENKIDSSRIANALKEALDEIDKIFQINKIRLKLLKKLTSLREKSPEKLNRLKTDFRYIDIELEQELNKIEFYKIVVLNNVSVESVALRHKYKTVDGDIVGNIEKGEKYLYGMITEIEVFCGVAKELLGEYFDFMREDAIKIEGCEEDC